MRSVGFEVAYTDQFNRLGGLGWLVSGCLLRRRRLSPSQMIWFDRLLWLVKPLEHLLPTPGLSLIVVGRKPSSRQLMVTVRMESGVQALGSGGQPPIGRSLSHGT